MVIVFGVLGIMLFVACVLTRNIGKELYDAKEYKFGMGLAVWLEKKMKLSQKNGTVLWKAMDNITNHDSVDIAMKKHMVRKIYYCVLVMSVVVALGLLLSLKQACSSGTDSIDRPAPGEGSMQVTKKVVIDNKTEEITFDVSERCPDDEEIEEKFDEAKKYIDDNFLGENTSAQEVYLPLKLVESTPEKDVEIFWITDEDGYISADGSIERIKKEDGVIVTISAILSYAGHEEEYIIPIKLVPNSKDVDKVEELLDVIKEEDGASVMNSELKLPDKIGDDKVSYVEEGAGGIFVIVVLAVVSIIALIFFSDEDVRKKNMYRSEEMLIDYPEIMVKFGVYLKAGLTSKSAWGRIVEEYCQRVKNGEKNRYAYEEMLLTWNEMKNGVSTVEAYERFGRRCDILQYNKFATWLIQNNRKGSNGLIELIETESYEAKEERNKVIRIKGEKISQNLLVPMMGLMVVVMLIVMVPAFLGML